MPLVSLIEGPRLGQHLPRHEPVPHLDRVGGGGGGVGLKPDLRGLGPFGELPVQPVKPRADAQPVRLKAFADGKAFGGGADGFQRLGRHAGQRGALHEVKDGKAGGEAGGAGGGQDVVRAADIIADGLGRVGAKEDRAGVGDLLRQGVGVGGAEFKVFGGDAV